MNQQQDTSWWERNWKWFVPVGCLGSLILFVGIIALFMCFILGMMKSSDVYRDAVGKAKAHLLVQESIGIPIEEGLFITGEVNSGGGSGEANLSIPVSGPEGEGTIYLEATKIEGQWTFSTLVVVIKGTKRKIDLLE